nr:aminopeptidase P1-like [Ziziphus jujuba var. spinosa]
MLQSSIMRHKQKLVYLDGTTDIRRTVHFGKPSEHEKACYTAVLKGHIALRNARFPNGTNGNALDILAQVPLWKNGLDYRHGTCHGIGSSAIMFKNINNRVIEVYNPIINILDHDGCNS